MRTVTALPNEITEEEHLWIPLPDGTRLAARLWRPVSSDDDPVPGVLEMIPYRKRDLTAQRDSIHHPYMAGYGYACLRVDLRGSGDSEGVLTDEYLEQELSDGEAVLAWMAQQPWCSGRTAMMGISWGGFNALQIAARQPPSLGAIVTVCSTDDRYTDDVHYMGGCLLSDNLSPARPTRPSSARTGGSCGWTGSRTAGCGWRPGCATSTATITGGTGRSTRTIRPFRFPSSP